MEDVLIVCDPRRFGKLTPTRSSEKWQRPKVVTQTEEMLADRGKAG
jgi:hypothetical protein